MEFEQWINKVIRFLGRMTTGSDRSDTVNQISKIDGARKLGSISPEKEFFVYLFTMLLKIRFISSPLIA